MFIFMWQVLKASCKTRVLSLVGFIYNEFTILLSSTLFTKHYIFVQTTIAIYCVQTHAKKAEENVLTVFSELIGHRLFVFCRE